jgi:hypothetical protein
MNSSGKTGFYAGLDRYRGTVGELFLSESHFSDVPPDWSVIITDIRDSTKAIDAGHHQTVNFLATGSIVAALNLAFKSSIELPFFFGGDGATMLVPPGMHEQLLNELFSYQTDVLRSFSIDIRVGCIPVTQLYDEGRDLRLAKYGMSSLFSIPILLGDGLRYAEKLIKDHTLATMPEITADAAPDLSGMQCRWDRIAAPEHQEEILTLLVAARDDVRQADAFWLVMNCIEQIYGSPDERQPISIKRLRQGITTKGKAAEFTNWMSFYGQSPRLQEKLMGLFRRLYLRTGQGTRYLERLVALSDTLVIDGRINTVISGTAEQRKHLVGVLDLLEKMDVITYGIHLSTASVMSCYVRNMEDGHIHFVDGADGGYTRAAQTLKRKMPAIPIRLLKH